VGKRKGHDSVFCDGVCQEWIHRQCAGLSTTAFLAVSQSANPFHCPRCLLFQQSKEIESLKASVEKLTSEICSLKSQFSQLSSEVVASGLISDNLPICDLNPESVSPQASNHAPHPQPRRSSSVSAAAHSQVSQDRKYNVIMFGVPEQPQGTPRMERCRSEFKEVSSILLNVELESDHHSTICDCHRIGRYNPNADRSRPMLVSLSSTADVRNILSLRRSLPSHVQTSHPMNVESGLYCLRNEGSL
jgi:hypothetical protein